MKLVIEEPKELGRINEDQPQYLEIMAEELDQLGCMAEGDFGLCLWLSETDEDKKEMARTVLISIKNICDRIAKLNGIKL